MAELWPQTLMCFFFKIIHVTPRLVMDNWILFALSLCFTDSHLFLFILIKSMITQSDMLKNIQCCSHFFHVYVLKDILLELLIGILKRKEGLMVK